LIVKAAESLVKGLTGTTTRLIAVNGAGGLEVAPGVRLVDAPDFPAAWKGLALAHIDAMEVFRRSPINWTCASPAAFVEPGTRTGKFRLGTDQLVADAKGESRISCEDFAVALVDELENKKFIRARFTAAY
jgi:putative NADH-flavin reductase